MKNRGKAILVIVVLLLAGSGTYVVLVSLPSRSPPGGSHLAGCVPTPTSRATGSMAGNWTTYHRDVSRSALETMPNITAVHSAWTGPASLDGLVYAEPLVCGGSIFVATENDSVYAINATSGQVLWRIHLGSPVVGSSLPCGNIDPSGITGTPVLDVSTSTLYVVAFLDPAHHELFGLNTTDGLVRSQVSIDPVGADPRVEQQRGALALANGVVYVPYGGLAGDCGQYHGWIVGARTNGSGGLLSFEVPTGRAGGIWTPAGISIAPNGDLYVATGNSDATTTFDYGDSVIRLSPSLQVLDYFAPPN